jgi:hypothetical protein
MKFPCPTMTGFAARFQITTVAAAALAAAAAAFAVPAQAASGSLDSLGASATEVAAGSWVDLSVAFSIVTSANSYGGSNLTEPEPQEGYQEWFANWYYIDGEAVSSVTLQIDGQGTTEFLNLSPGSSYSSSWTTSVLFDTPGQYTVTAGGNWAGEFTSYYSNESAWRNCYATDPDYGGSLQCDAWNWTYSDGGDRYGIGGDFAPLSLTINVTAVPEPGTLALWLAGAALLASRSRRRE